MIQPFSMESIETIFYLWTKIKVEIFQKKLRQAACDDLYFLESQEKLMIRNKHKLASL